MNKKTIIITAIILVLCLGIGLSVGLTWYMYDAKDTEENFRANVLKVAYENTIETAIPQTELYDLINNHFDAPLVEGKTEKKAVVIGYDGCRADVLTEMQSNNSGINAILQEGGSLNLSYCGGVNYPAKNTQDTSTAPGWCSILTGEWATVHGITGNDMSKNMETKTLLTSLVESGKAESSSFVTKWAGHFSRKNATYLLEKEYCEENNLNVDFNKCKNNEKSLETALGEIGKEDCVDFIFVIYEQTDAEGHGYGFTINNPDYKKAFKEADSYGYETIQKIKSRPTYASEDWLIIITADHGGININHGKASIQERMTFIATNQNL